jgi:hydroxypyruvate isomerase
MKHSPPMCRRDFLRHSLAAAAAATSIQASPSLLAEQRKERAAKPRRFRLKYAPHFGMFEQSAGADLIDQLRFMADQGFTAFEDNDLMRRPPEVQQRIGSELQRLGMTMGVFVLDKGGNEANSLNAGKAEYLEIFLDGCRRALDTARRVNAKWVTLVPGNFERTLPMGIQMGHLIDALRRGVQILEPHGLVMVLEPLSDTPDLFLRTSDQTYEICRAVASPSCKVLFDMYHLQRNEGDLIAHMELAWQEIAYFQVGNVPGRNEPGSGEIDYRNIFRHLHAKGYTGVIGMEHGNSQVGKAGERALIEAYRAADSF